MKTITFAGHNPPIPNRRAKDPAEARYENAWGPTRIEAPMFLPAHARMLLLSVAIIAMAAPVIGAARHFIRTYRHP